MRIDMDSPGSSASVTQESKERENEFRATEIRGRIVIAIDGDCGQVTTINLSKKEFENLKTAIGRIDK